MGSKRQTLHVPGISHGANPIPSGVRLGNVVFSGGISGQDPATGQLPAEPEKQAELAFANLRRLMEAAGGSADDIGHVTVYLKDLGHRDHINREWLKMFPDEHDRPTRHTLRYDLAGNMLLQLQVIGVIT
jgi:enamine deaminase RidA (YjgF/YER057c/UK114 family)